MWQRIFGGQQSDRAYTSLRSSSDPSKLSNTYVIGDIHGQFDRLVALLQGADLIDEQLGWSGEAAHLCFAGDLFDRGPGGIVALELIMRLQQEALAADGKVDALLGNHEVLILAVCRFGDRRISPWSASFEDVWLRNGGIESDVANLSREQIDWLLRRPAMLPVLDSLFIHADSLAYAEYGETISEVNEAIGAVLAADDIYAWDQLLQNLSLRRAFSGSQGDGADYAEAFLDFFGGRRIIHGHTPISNVTKFRPNRIDEPLIYADELCVNVDGGMYQGGPGFVYRLPKPDPASPTENNS